MDYDLINKLNQYIEDTYTTFTGNYSKAGQVYYRILYESRINNDYINPIEEKEREFSTLIKYSKPLIGYYVAFDHPYHLVGNWREWLISLVKDKIINTHEPIYLVEIEFPEKTPLLIGGTKQMTNSNGKIETISEYFAIYNKSIKILRKNTIDHSIIIFIQENLLSLPSSEILEYIKNKIG